MADTFLTRKQHVVSSLVEALDPNRRDKSPKGFVDAPILDLIHIINEHPDYYTTSSCSGRIAIYCEGLEKAESEDTLEKTTKGGTWLYVTHDPVDIPTMNREQRDQWVLKLLFGDQIDRVSLATERPENILQKQLVYFKFEPLILHVEASHQHTAMRLLGLAFQAGYQNSGITPSRSRQMLAIRSTHKLDTPIAYVDPITHRIVCLVDPDYLYLLVTMSNQKFMQNMDRMKLFLDMMKKEVESANIMQHVETKEERRERKRREGMAKQQALQAQTSNEVSAMDTTDTSS
ncbi:tRNA wybutosine-synthesizing protein [Radiomyces spectabilis]|uniref:tRNA wybutosine-synthesizing protein n=1 Tax=Radiomyces spectabilis TaxID=64574 RepID=UPI00221E9E41|nr:tRNA wybutosine-synthesizing protein [Radiomyces spectabilis]KAI8393757.1 tRNA wybutosine-synthesizing protein [Radiomyces spectabilis]